MADLSIKLKTEADAQSFAKSVNDLSKKVPPVKIKISSSVGDGIGSLEKKLGPLSSRIADTYERLASLRTEGSLTEKSFFDLSAQVDNVRESLEKGNISFAKGSSILDKITDSANGTKTGFFNLSQGLIDAASKFTTWYLLAGVITGIINALKQMVAEVISLDAAMVELNKVFDASNIELNRVKDRAFELADGLGTTGKAVIEATTEFKRMGYTIDESLDLAKVATTMTNVAEGITDTGDAANILTSILKGTGVSSEYAMSLLDRLNEVSNNNAISFDALANMLQSTASTMNILGNNTDETIGMLTGAYAVIQDERVGKALTTIGLRISGLNEDLETEAGLANDVSKSLQKYAGIDVFDEQTGQIKSTYEIMKELSTVWDDLNKNEQAVLLNKLAGKNRADVAAALLANWENVDEAIEDAANSMGSAKNEQEKYLNSIKGKLEAIKNLFQETAKEMIPQEVIKSTLDLVKALMEVVKPIGTAVGLMIKASGISQQFKSLANALSLIGKYLQGIYKFWQPVIDVIYTLQESIFTITNSINDELFEGLELLAKKIMEWFGPVINIFNKVTGWISNTTSKVVGWIKGWFGEADQETKDIAETFNKSEKDVTDYDRALFNLKKTLGELRVENEETLENLKKQNEEIENQKELNDKLLAVEKARQELAEAKNKRVRVFRAGIGFTYETDTAEVQTAQENLQSAVDELSEFKYDLVLSRAEEFVEKFAEILSGSDMTEGWQELFDNFADLMDTEFEYFITNAKESIKEFNETIEEKEKLISTVPDGIVKDAISTSIGPKISLNSISSQSKDLTNDNIAMPNAVVRQSSNLSVDSVSNPSPQIASAGKNITLQFNGPLEFPNVTSAEDASGFIDAVVSVGNSRVPKYS